MKKWNNAENIVANMTNNLIDSFENTPEEITVHPLVKDFMYNASLRLLTVTAKILGVTKERVKSHIDIAWDKKEKILN